MKISRVLNFIKPVSALGPLLIAALCSLPLRADDQAEVNALLDSFDNLWIENQTFAEITMKVSTQQFNRELKLKYWGKGADKSLVRIVYPPKEKGVSTLRVGKDVYNFVPKIGRTTKISDALMSQSWMGSHLTNSDLMRTTHLATEYDVKLLEKKKGAQGTDIWILEALAKPSVATLHQRLLIHFDSKTRLPIEQDFFDKTQKLLRTFTYSAVKNYNGKLVPSHIHVVPADSELKGESTEFIYDKIDRKSKIGDNTFSLTELSDL